MSFECCTPITYSNVVTLRKGNSTPVCVRSYGLQQGRERYPVALGLIASIGERDIVYVCEAGPHCITVRVNTIGKRRCLRFITDNKKKPI